MHGVFADRLDHQPGRQFEAAAHGRAIVLGAAECAVLGAIVVHPIHDQPLHEAGGRGAGAAVVIGGPVQLGEMLEAAAVVGAADDRLVSGGEIEAARPRRMGDDIFDADVLDALVVVA